MLLNLQSADLDKFTEKMLNGILHLLLSEKRIYYPVKYRQWNVYAKVTC